MAPTKKDAKEAKEAKLTPEQSTTLILDYLRKNNRPYSATDISANLKNRVSKAAAAKLLKDMHERREIEGRAAGKQLVYHAIQDEADETSLEKLEELDAKTKRLQEDTASLKAEEKELRIALRESLFQPSLTEIKASVASLESEREEMTTRLAKLQDGSLSPVSIEQREKTNADYRRWQRCANARTKIRKELWAEIASLVGKDKAEETKEELGLDF